MTVGELKQRLGDYDEDMEIRIAFQPQWPLRGVIQDVVADTEIFDREVEGGVPAVENTAMGEEYLWIAVDQVSSSSENPYAPKGAWS